MRIGKSTECSSSIRQFARQVPGLKRERLLGGHKTKAIGADVTRVRCNGAWVTIGIVVDAVNGMVLSAMSAPGEDAAQQQAWQSQLSGNGLVGAEDADQDERRGQADQQRNEDRALL